MIAITFAWFRPMMTLTAIAWAAVGLSTFLVTLAQVPGPSIAQVQVAQQRAGQAVAKSPMSRCMATWDRTAQMPKQEWKETCKRVIKENPGLYNKPF